MSVLSKLSRGIMTALRRIAGVVLLAVAGGFILTAWVDEHVLSGGLTVAATVNCSSTPGVDKYHFATLSYAFKGRSIKQYFPKEDTEDYPCGGTYQIHHSKFSDKWIVTKGQMIRGLARFALSPFLLLVGVAFLVPKQALALSQRLLTKRTTRAAVAD
jgi:hypothetical protein